MFLIAELLFIVLLVMILFMISRNERMTLKHLRPFAKVEGYWDGKERRQYVRFKKALDVTYKVEKKPHLKNSKTIDISRSGVKLLLDEKLSKGVIVALEIGLPGSEKKIEVEGKVVWSTEFQESDASGRRLFHSGIKFFAIREPSGTNLDDYIRSLCEETNV